MGKQNCTCRQDYIGRFNAWRKVLDPKCPICNRRPKGEVIPPRLSWAKPHDQDAKKEEGNG